MFPIKIRCQVIAHERRRGVYIEVYLDVVFAVNFILDFIILLLERKISRRKASINRIVLGAMVGAILMCIIVLIPKFNYILYLIFSYFISSILIVGVTFRPKCVKEWMQLTFLLYGIAVLLGGIIFALYYYALVGYSVNRFFKSNPLGLDLQMLLILLCIAVFVCVVFINICSRVMHITKNIYLVSIQLHNQEVQINGLLDTGNNLYDPITNWPVIIGEIEIFKDILNDEEYLQLLEVLSNIYDIERIEKLKNDFNINIRLIPFTSVGNENGMLMGIVLDGVSVQDGKELKENKNVILGLYNKKLSTDNSYRLLLHPKLV